MYDLLITAPELQQLQQQLIRLVQPQRLAQGCILEALSALTLAVRLSHNTLHQCPLALIQPLQGRIS